jgi:hypothetical protein
LEKLIISVASIPLKIPFPEKSKLSYNKEYGLFGLQQAALAEDGRRKTAEDGRRKTAEDGRRRQKTKEDGRRKTETFPIVSPSPISPCIPLSNLSLYPPPPSPLLLHTRFSGGQFLKEGIPNLHAANYYSVG